MRNFDLCVLGGGPGGTTAAVSASKAGLKTALIEENQLGGTCLNVGCIPSKANLEVSGLVSLIKKAKEFGLNPQLGPIDFSKVKAYQEETVRDLRDQLEKSVRASGVELVRGRGRFLSKNLLKVDYGKGSEEITATTVVIATGSSPKPLPLAPFDGLQILSSTDALALTDLPKSLAIVGAGATGCELASFFSAMGTQVTLLEMFEQLLPSEDSDLARRLEVAFRKKGIEIRLGMMIESLEKEKARVSLKLKGGDKIQTDRVVITVGRKRNTEELGLEAIGIRMEGDGIWVDENFETSTKGIFAVGDVLVGKPQLAHAAQAEASWVMDRLLGVERRKLDLSACPNCVFTDPPVASVGWTKVKAEQSGIAADEIKLPLGGLAKSQIARESEGFIKVVFERETGRIVGAHLLGVNATELISELTLAIQMKATVKELAEVIHPHPTFSEGIQEALQAVLGKSVHMGARK